MAAQIRPVSRKNSLRQTARYLFTSARNLSRYLNEHFNSSVEGMKIAIFVYLCNHAFRYVSPNIAFFRVPVLLIGVKLVLKYFGITTSPEFTNLQAEMYAWSHHDAPNPPPIITLGSLLRTAPFFLPSACVLLDALSIAKYLWSFLLSICFGWPVYMIYISLSYELTGVGKPARTLLSWLITKPFGSVAIDILVYILESLAQKFKVSTSYPVCKLACLFWPRAFQMCARIPLGIILILALVPIVMVWPYRNHLRVFYWFYIYNYRNARNIQYVAPRAKLRGLQYKYTSLDAGFIRVLDVLPRYSAKDGIRTKLCHVKLEDASFDAISYTWGHSGKVREVLVDGSWMSVTENAYAIIEDRVSTVDTKINTIWIDCICIDQENDDEKSQQVRIMDKIYQQADRTILWLGNTQEAIFAFTLVHDIASRIPIQPPAEYEMESKMVLIDSVRDLLYPRSDRIDFRFRELASLLQHPYFSRVWIIQEISNSEKLHMRYGRCWLDWSVFSHVARLLSDVRLAQTVGMEVLQLHTPNLGVIAQIRFLSRCREREQEHRLGRVDRPALAELLDGAQMAEATDKRDLIFGVLNLSAEAQNTDLAPDYRINSAELFRRVAKYLMETEGVQDVFYTAGIGYPRKMQDLPSWITDWSCRAKVNSLRVKGILTYDASKDASKDRHPPILGTETGSLIVKGIRFDKIASITPEPFPTGDVSEASAMAHLTYYLERCIVEIDARKCIRNLPNRYKWTGQPRDEVFTRTLIGDQSRRTFEAEHPFSMPPGVKNPPKDAIGIYERPAAIEKWAQRIQVWNEMLSSLENNGIKDIWPIMNQSKEFKELAIRLLIARNLLNNLAKFEFTDLGDVPYLGRKFAVTEKGLMALVPPLAEVGDEICVLFGLEVPFVLRRCLDVGALKWNLVGESYVHGIMDGEACVGDVDVVDFVID